MIMHRQLTLSHSHLRHIKRLRVVFVHVVRHHVLQLALLLEELVHPLGVVVVVAALVLALAGLKGLEFFVRIYYAESGERNA